jgi:hypothetical protein
MLHLLQHTYSEEQTSPEETREPMVANSSPVSKGGNLPINLSALFALNFAGSKNTGTKATLFESKVSREARRFEKKVKEVERYFI